MRARLLVGFYQLGDQSAMAHQPLSIFSQTCAAIGARDESLIAMLEAYFDESGNDDRSTIFTVAGFIATRSQWEAFEKEWKAFLGDEKIERFHRVDLECFQRNFHRDRGWDEARRDRVVREAQRIIGEHVLYGVKNSIIKKDYREAVLADTDEKVKSQLGKNYYTFCGQAVMRKIAVWAAHNSHNEAIRYFFESGAKGEGELLQVISKIVKRKREKALFRYGGMSFVEKYDEVIDGVLFPGVVQLHAADVLAYEGYKWMENKIALVKRPPRDSYTHLTSLGVLMVFSYHDKEGLAEIVRRYKAGDITCP